MLSSMPALAQAPPPQVAGLPEDSALAEADSTVLAQRDLMDVVASILNRDDVNSQLDLQRGLQWALLPTFSYNPVYGAAFGALISGAGRRGEAATNYSNISIAANYATSGQVQVQIRGDVFSPGANYLTKVDVRYLDTGRSTWGLGPIDEQADEYPMEFLLRRVYLTVMRRISGPVYVGVGYHFDEFDNIVDQRAEQGESTPFTDYSGGSLTRTLATGLSLHLLTDTRDNQVNASDGYLLNWEFRDELGGLGADAEWQEMWVEARMYPRVPSSGDNVLAFWLYGWFTFGQPPYLNLPSNGWDTYGRGARGYLAGRIRGTSQIYVESEYRWTISDDGLWGAVVFANATSTTNDDGVFATADYGVGAGLRVRLNKSAGTNITLDYGWGLNAGSGLFLGLGEVF